MKIHMYISALLFMLSIFQVPAQETLTNQALVSPEVGEEGRVTFRLKAPDAREVKLTGDWMPQEQDTSLRSKIPALYGGQWDRVHRPHH